ncbi:MAG: hypothetical protein U9R00_03325 [Patescibacteria group bacterium]|nr:hypothetical protein [Patescibacteria group bacterium]
MGLFSKPKKKGNLVAIFDIGSGSVGGALALIEKNKVPTILTSTRSLIKFQDELDFKIFLEDTIEALGKVADTLYHTKIGAPTEIVCTLSSPWYLSESRVIKIEKDKKFVFDKDFADDLVKKEIDKLKKDYDKKYSELEGKFNLIENQITSIKLNGYSIKDPMNKKVRRVEMNMVTSLSPDICVSRIRDVLSKTFHHIPIEFSSFVNSTHIALCDKYQKVDSYVFIDMGGEITDVNIFNHNILENSISFPFGYQTFYRFLKKKLKKDLSEVKSLFNLYFNDDLEEEEKEKMEKALKSISGSWTEAFHQSIESLGNPVMMLPNQIFIIANSDIVKWFSEIVSNEEYVRSVFVGSDYYINTLEGADFNNMCSVRNTTYDSFLIIETIAVSKKKTCLKI